MTENLTSTFSPTAYASLLHPVRLQETVRDWLKEDTPSFDYGGFVVGSRQEEAVLLCKSHGVLAGVPFFDAVFRELRCTVEWLRNEGDFLDPVCTVATVRGSVKDILLGERVALNCLARASGVATGARRLVQLARSVTVPDGGLWSGEVCGTRKTTPGFRMVEKYALLVGGMGTHRYDLSSMVMLKDNHIWAAGSIKQAVLDARKVCGFSSKIEVECRSVDEALTAAASGADVIMLDNFDPQALHAGAATIKAKFPAIIIEASGGVNESNLSRFADPNVDVISLGGATQGYSIVDFSLKICAEGHDPTNPTVRL